MKHVVMESRKSPVATIMVAAKSCYLQFGVAKTGMGEVAKCAGIARSTLYRYFPTRDELLFAIIKQEIIETNTQIRATLSQYRSAHHYIVEGIILALREIPKNALLHAVFVADDDSAVRRVIWQSDIIVELGSEMMEQVFSPALAAGQLQEHVGVEVLTEWIYRILLSFLTLPSNCIQNDTELRSTLHALLIPVLLKPESINTETYTSHSNREALLPDTSETVEAEQELQHEV